MEAVFTSQAKKDQFKRLSNDVLRRTIVNVFLFAILYLMLVLGFFSLVGNFFYEIANLIWGGNPQITTLLSRIVMIGIGVGFVGGIVMLVRSGINRALRYFDLLFDSVTDVLSKREGPIMLPSELAPTALFLNNIKAESEQSERVAKAAEERKNELVMYLAHDIKTPLTSIIGYLSLMEESPDLPLEVRARYAEITLEKAYRLEELLDEFFEITRYNLQAIPIERSRFDAPLFCSQVIEEFYPLAEARSISIEFDGPAALPVFADAGRVARVLNNVLKNAVAYADRHTQVHVHTGIVRAQDGFMWWELTVTNQGHELSPQHLEHIFEKFFRADTSRGSDTGGAGLGLAIGREIARAHGGDIYARSESGITSFTIWIPQGPSVS